MRVLLQVVGLAAQGPVAAAGAAAMLLLQLLLLLLAMHQDALGGHAALVGEVDLLRRAALARAPA